LEAFGAVPQPERTAGFREIARVDSRAGDGERDVGVSASGADGIRA
jgi:hypothetical protein